MNTVFVDTSVLIAAEDTGQGALHAAVLQWLDLLWRTRSGRTGSQALCEFYEQVTTAAQPLPQGDARAAIRRYQTWTPWKTDAATLETAWAEQSRHQLPGRGLRPAQRLRADADPAPAARCTVWRRGHGAPAAPGAAAGVAGLSGPADGFLPHCFVKVCMP
jgi:hypothetical protein